MKQAIQRNIDVLAFAAAIAAYFLSQGIINILQADPVGFHFIRQTDSLSFADTYACSNYPFLEPHTWNLTSDGGKAACEFPLLYALAAQCYSLTGPSPLVMRLMVFIISFAGFISLYVFMRRMTGNRAVAFPLALLCMSSTVVIHYASVPMVDGAALGFTLTGLNLAHRGRVTGASAMWTLTGILAFTLGALLKVTFAIVPLAWMLSECPAWWQRISSTTSSYPRSTQVWTALVTTAGCAAVVAWYCYARSYNAVAGDSYFLTAPRHLLSLDKQAILDVLDAIAHRWKQAWYTNETWWLVAASGALCIWKWKHMQPGVAVKVALAVAGTLTYAFLFFGQFSDHDYYFLPLVPVVAMVLAAVPYTTILPDRSGLRILGWMAITACTFSSLIYATGKWHKRYAQPETMYSELPMSLAVIKHEAAAMAGNRPVVIIGDLTRNGSLYVLKKPGYTFPTWEAWLDFSARTPTGEAMIIARNVPADKQVLARPLGESSGWWAIDYQGMTRRTDQPVRNTTR